MDALRAKAELAAYWRFHRGMSLVAVEAEGEDVLVVDKQRRLLIVEVKVSVSDLRNDIFKPVHHAIRGHLTMFPYQLQCKSPRRQRRFELASQLSPYSRRIVPSRFYFGMPEDLCKKGEAVINERFPYAGLLSVGESGGAFLGHRIVCVKPAQQIHKDRIALRNALELVKAQSASLANAYSRLVRVAHQAETCP